MKRILIIPIVLFLLLSSGCNDIDWKAQSKRFFADLIETTMQVAIAEYGDSKMECIDWVIKYIE